MSTVICICLHYALYLMQLSVACNLIPTGDSDDNPRWIISHRCCWITVYVSCRNAQLNIIVVIMSYICIVMRSIFCQLPSCNLFTQHVSYLLWRDTTSELWTPVHSFTSEYKSTAIITFCIFLQATIIIHTICLILCF